MRRTVDTGSRSSQPPTGHTDGLVTLAAEVLAKTNRTVERMAERGLEPQRSWAETGMLRQFWQRQEWILTNCGGLV